MKRTLSERERQVRELELVIDELDNVLGPTSDDNGSGRGVLPFVFPEPRYDPHANSNEETLRKIAAARGLVVIYPRNDELFIDLDNHARLNGDAFSVLVEKGYVTSILRLRSSGGQGHHVYIRVAEALSPQGRLALQAALGSDPVREALGFFYAQKGYVPTVLFETPENAATVAAWRANKEMDIHGHRDAA